MMMVVTVLMVIILVNRGMCLCGNCYGDDIGDDHENMFLNMLNMLSKFTLYFPKLFWIAAIPLFV